MYTYTLYMYLDYVLRWPFGGCCTVETCRNNVEHSLSIYMYIYTLYMYLDYVLRWPDDGCCTVETCRNNIEQSLSTYMCICKHIHFICI